MRSPKALLNELIALPSVNPGCVGVRAERSGERRVAEFLAACAAKAGLDVALEPVLPGRFNLLARLTPPSKPARRILLAPHLDTINGSDGQFVPRTRNGRIYGRGACDTKGSVAAMFFSLCALARHGRRPAKTEIVFAGFIDEECYQAGSRALARTRLNADLALVGEPTRNRVLTAHKGSLWLEFRVRGRSAHGSQPEKGRNAIRAMAQIVELLETAYREDLLCRAHPLLGHPTSSVGEICGGVQPNVVPDLCVIRVDRRTLPGETEKGVIREAARFLRKHGLKAEVCSVKQEPCLPMETDPSLPLVRSLMRAARQHAPLGAQYFCDAAVLSAAGIPSVIFGPGDISQAHTADEWIEIQSLERNTSILDRFLRSLP